MKPVNPNIPSNLSGPGASGLSAAGPDASGSDVTEKRAHQPVMLAEAVAGLAVRPDGLYVDATFGRGGHSQAILQCLNEGGRLLVLDQDPAAIEVARRGIGQDPRVRVEHRSFIELTEVLVAMDWQSQVDGVLLDLGVSSPQLDDPSRGFSFLHDGPLDMRMNPSRGLSAAEWLARASDKEIANVLWEYGEERFSRRIARAIIAMREKQPLVRTVQLANIIAAAVPRKEKHKHPATRSFQAIRIFINQELVALECGLQQAFAALRRGGRLCVITFHSLEDRLVKQFMRTKVQGGLDVPAGVPLTEKQLERHARLIDVQEPSEAELQSNRRARSARLRILEKINE